MSYNCPGYATFARSAGGIIAECNGAHHLHDEANVGEGAHS